jgi:hypothetical protein
MASSAGAWRRETDSSGRAYFWHPTTGAARWTLDESESERFDKATRANNPRKGLLHYQNRLKKAKRLVKLDKVEKFAGKIAKYKAICYGPMPYLPGAGLHRSKRWLGVYWDPNYGYTGSWRAYVSHGGKPHHWYEPNDDLQKIANQVERYFMQAEGPAYLEEDPRWREEWARAQDGDARWTRFFEDLYWLPRRR